MITPAVELCVTDVAGALLADRRGLARVELCADLAEGGITPSIGFVAAVLARVARVGVQVLIRPRPGDFDYDGTEIEVALRDIAAVRSLRVAATVPVGFVVGALLPDGRVDVDTTRALVSACGAAPVTFHRAFDLVPDPFAALEDLVRLGCARVLTAGGAPTAAAGAPALAALVRAAAGRIGVLAGGGIRADTVAGVLRTGVPEIHLAARRTAPAAGPAPDGPAVSGTRQDTDPDVLDDLLAALDAARTRR